MSGKPKILTLEKHEVSAIGTVGNTAPARVLSVNNNLTEKGMKRGTGE